MRLALMIGTGILAGTVLAGPAQAQGYDWGGGTCIGYGCARPVYRDGYRGIRHYDEEDVRPDVRVYERRVYRHHDWDDDDDLDD